MRSPVIIAVISILILTSVSFAGVRVVPNVQFTVTRDVSDIVETGGLWLPTDIAWENIGVTLYNDTDIIFVCEASTILTLGPGRSATVIGVVGNPEFHELKYDLVERGWCGILGEFVRVW